ncbi:hypothetical protein PoB_007128700 [Plakobranchus ocellatus]|uniref:Uncharacterized protein n=1 Tax=Plakobranchus ocellatus TaxID=259542 RepID=A0AAV4DL57_9GAST|nr:hypothetical protein PoB_007128700 [Plakobranchus ocellatus]
MVILRRLLLAMAHRRSASSQMKKSKFAGLILEASSIYYGLTLREVRNLAYEIATAFLCQNHGPLQKLQARIGLWRSGIVKRPVVSTKSRGDFTQSSTGI